ncbi:FMN-dependent NADH-azoreductase [Fibrisoma limi BUZ 3]|uniref:FMN dependent NADH:quinone oxidoreductase n=1 Tax=Fibrisoma limi BUZ 3 TaxID=1185876 RepID=I2GG73_9BACT|nr:FMN-dependent NADH-azoreductase [Fibrisoma limi]CCH52898.1 FMN-dependent NADH-azoreductase [Fibrisoma limi BUZ 3]
MNILHVVSSPRGDASYSIKLGNGLIEKIQAAYPDSIVRVRDLANQPLPHMGENLLEAFFTPSEVHSPAQQAAVRHSDEAIRELLEADVLIIGVPMYNFNIPSTLKAWIDHITRARVTFRYTPSGPEGLVQGKKVYLAIASGGVYSEGPGVANDFAAPYLKTVLSFLGMTDVTLVRAEGIKIPDLQESALEKALNSVQLELLQPV